jgi:tetratricopeptide (TPR) repeat protein
MGQQGAFRKFWMNDQRIMRLVLLTFALVIVLGIVFGAYYYWDRYIHLGDKSPTDLAAEHLLQQVRENPQDPDLRVTLAGVYLKDGLPQQAIDQAAQVLEQYPDHQEALLVVGLSYSQLGEMQPAVAALEKFSDMRRNAPMSAADPVLEAALYFLGQNYLILEEPNKAEIVLLEALEIERTDADAMYLLGQAYAQQNKHQLAIKQYLNAARFVPDFTEAYQAMAASYSKTGEHDYTNYALGAQAFSLGDYAEAQEVLSVSIESLPNFAPAYWALGLTYEKMGDWEKAQKYLIRSLELDPGSYVAEHALGRIEAAIETGK